jgi:hypothetical protein
MHKQFCRRRDKGIGKTPADAAIEKPDGDIRMIDSTYICGARGGSQDISRTKGVLNSKLHLAVDEYGIPASGTVADCSQAPLLMDGLETEAFLADKAHDTNELLGMLKEADIAVVIPTIKNRKEQRTYSHELYRARKTVGYRGSGHKTVLREKLRGSVVFVCLTNKTKQIPTPAATNSTAGFYAPTPSLQGCKATEKDADNGTRTHA